MDLPLTNLLKDEATSGPQGACSGWAGSWSTPLLVLLLALQCPWLTAQESISAPAKDSVGVYLEAIERAETLGGPYAVELVDLYHGYGQALLEEGDLEEARDAFHRTAMVARVNSGPNSLEQTNYLYGIAQVESLLGNLDESVGILANIYSLHARHYGEDDPAMLPVVQQIYAWYQEKQPLNAPLARSSDYLNRSFLAGRIAALSEKDLGLGTSETAMRYRELGQMHFHAIYYMLQTGEPPQPQLVMNNNNGSGSQWYFERSISAHFKAGEEVFARVVESWHNNPEATDLEVAEGIAQLGDWYLALQHFRSAEKQYERAYRVLASSKTFAGVADEYMGAPSPLRFLNTTDRFVRDLAAPVPEGGLAISMTVTRNGSLHDVKLVSTPEGASEKDFQELAQRLENTRFRPAIINGEAERIEGFVWRPPAVVRKIAAADG